MTPRPPAAGTRLSGKLGLSDRIFGGLRARTLLSTVEAGLDLVESALEREVRSADKLADVTARYLYEAGGKRVRPMLAQHRDPHRRPAVLAREPAHGSSR